jgi:hypothetical protein
MKCNFEFPREGLCLVLMYVRPMDCRGCRSIVFCPYYDHAHAAALLHWEDDGGAVA